jgi:hypothetical protein
MRGSGGRHRASWRFSDPPNCEQRIDGLELTALDQRLDQLADFSAAFVLLFLAGFATNGPMLLFPLFSPPLIFLFAILASRGVGIRQFGLSKRITGE